MKRRNGTRRPLDVKPGDRVLFGKYSGSEVKIDDQEYLIMREDALQNATSIAGLLLTTEAVVAEIPEDKKKGAGMPMPSGDIDY